MIYFIHSNLNLTLGSAPGPTPVRYITPCGSWGGVQRQGVAAGALGALRVQRVAGLLLVLVAQALLLQDLEVRVGPALHRLHVGSDECVGERIGGYTPPRQVGAHRESDNNNSL